MTTLELDVELACRNRAVHHGASPEAWRLLLTPAQRALYHAVIGFTVALCGGPTR